VTAKSRGLATYRGKRHFERTPEPKGNGRARKKPTGEHLSFVVQKHAARRLHYDFRLEMEHVLRSWAVPKGPSLDPHDKRLAVETEDHPLEYGSFEGTIPEGEYGAGKVEVWDRGTWEPETDPNEAYRRGRLSFTLRGKRLRGSWHLVRTGKSESGPKSQWLLMRASAGVASAPPVRPVARSVRVSHPDRVLYPEIGVTKAELAQYYAEVADAMLPHVARRPLMLLRCPEGRRASCFFQKHASRGMPSAIHEVSIREEEGVARDIFVEDAEGLAALVQISSLEIHVWGALVDDVDRPDRLVFDLDPDRGVDFARVVDAAHRLRERLRAVGLESFARTTGGKGLHLVCPITRKVDWTHAENFCRTIAESLVRDDPTSFVATMSKAKRRGKIFIDYLRNARGATSIASYSARAREGAPVATPVVWKEVTAALRPERFTVRTVVERLSKVGDPWPGFFELRQSIAPSALKRALATREPRSSSRR
jgi:bifunctional non-homologous end joining protein LigD